VHSSYFDQKLQRSEFESIEVASAPRSSFAESFERKVEIAQSIESQFVSEIDLLPKEEVEKTFTSDVNWGCTIRVAQMMLCQVFQQLGASPAQALS